MDGDGEEGEIVKDFSNFFEKVHDWTRDIERKEPEFQMINFLLSVGTRVALDYFYRLDKDRGGTVSLREFVFGLKDIKSLPRQISLNDLWTFAARFDADASGTIDKLEWTEFIKNLTRPPDLSTQVYMCRIPETIIFSDGQPARWFSSNGLEGKVLSRPLGDRPWDHLTSVLRSQHRSLPADLRKGDANFCVVWMQDANHNFTAKAFNYLELRALREQPTTELKHLAAIQSFVPSARPKVWYRAVFDANGSQTGQSTCYVLEQYKATRPLHDKPFPPLDPSTGKPCKNPQSAAAHSVLHSARVKSEVSSRAQLQTIKFVRVLERVERRRVGHCELIFVADNPTSALMNLTLVACPVIETSDAPPGPRKPRKARQGYTASMAALPTRCQGQFCLTLPEAVAIDDVHVLATLQVPDATTASYALPSTVLHLTRRLIPPSSVFVVVQSVYANTKVSAGKMDEFELKVRAEGRVTGQLTLWAEFSGPTTKHLFLSLESPAGTVCSIERATNPKKKASPPPALASSAKRRQGSAEPAPSEDGRDTDPPASPSSPPPPAHVDPGLEDNVVIRHGIKTLEGEQVSGVWRLRMTESIALRKEATLLVWGISTSATSMDSEANPDLGSPEHSRQELRIPRVASLHKKDPTAGTTRQEDAWEPRVVYLPRCDVREGKAAQGPTIAEKEAERIAHQSADQPIRLDDLLEGCGDQAGMLGSPLGMELDSLKRQSPKGKRAPVRRRRQSITADPAMTKSLKNKTMNPARYHPEYMRNYRQSLLKVNMLKVDNIKELERQDIERYGLKGSHFDRTKSGHDSDSSDEFDAVRQLGKWLRPKAKPFAAWRLFTEDARKAKEEAKRNAKLPPGAEQSQVVTTQHLIWAEERGLKPAVQLPRRPDKGGHTARVCERCFRVYTKLEATWQQHAQATIRSVRSGCRRLGVSPTECQGIASSLRDWSAAPPINTAESYRRGLELHARRRIAPEQRQLLLEHSQLLKSCLLSPSARTPATSPSPVPAFSPTRTVRIAPQPLPSTMSSESPPLRGGRDPDVALGRYSRLLGAHRGGAVSVDLDERRQAGVDAPLERLWGEAVEEGSEEEREASPSRGWSRGGGGSRKSTRGESRGSAGGSTWGHEPFLPPDRTTWMGTTAKGHLAEARFERAITPVGKGAVRERSADSPDQGIRMRRMITRT